jgi:hypothetical protein
MMVFQFCDRLSLPVIRVRRDIAIAFREYADKDVAARDIM